MCLEDTVRIPLRAKDGSVRAYALVDAVDSSLVNQWSWHLASNGYVVRRTTIRNRPICIWLHRLLLGLPSVSDGRTGDHINRNKLDNRRVNLRVLTQAENAQNRPSAHGGTSPYRGVHWDRQRQKWKATIRLHGRQVNLGRFDNEIMAAEAARVARMKWMPYSID